MNLTLRELGVTENALVRLHTSYLDKRRKMRPNERAVAMAEVRRILSKIRDEIERLEDEENQS